MWNNFLQDKRLGAEAKIRVETELSGFPQWRENRPKGSQHVHTYQKSVVVLLEGKHPYRIQPVLLGKNVVRLSGHKCIIAFRISVLVHVHHVPVTWRHHITYCGGFLKALSYGAGKNQLLRNGSVNTFQHTRVQQYSRSVFYVVKQKKIWS
jgi:hypothetical protein